MKKSSPPFSPPPPNLARRVLRKVFRWLPRTVLGLLLVVIVVFVIGVLINLKDETLSTEAQTLMTAPASVAAPDKNGYFVLSAMDADESLDALATGRDINSKYAQLFHENPARMDYDQKAVYKKAPEAKWEANRCQSANGVCLDADLFNRTQLEAALKHDALLLQRYELLQQLPEFEEPPFMSAALPPPRYGVFFKAADMAMTRAAFDIADGKMQKGIDELKANDRYLRRMLRQTSNLVSRMVVVAMLREQTSTVSELVEVYPALVEQQGEALADLMRPMSSQEQSFARVFTTEARLNLMTLSSLDFKHGMLSDSPEQNGRDVSRDISRLVVGRVANWFYQPNATANKLASAWSSIIRDGNQPSSEYLHVRQRWTEEVNKQSGHPYLPYVHYLSNPLGKTLLRGGLGNQDIYFDYLERSADADGYLRLVGLQIELRRKKLAGSAIQDYVNTAPTQFRSPYDGTPMTWLAGKRQLQFVGRQKATSNIDGGNVFAVRLR